MQRILVVISKHYATTAFSKNNLRTMINKSTGPTKPQMVPFSMDSQQLEHVTITMMHFIYFTH